jgi:hypothetical protein
VALTQTLTHGRAVRGRPFLAAAHAVALLGRRIMAESNQDWADRVGRHVSTIAIALLIALFAYGYLGWLVSG